jgi:membrane protease YdiL (CAAX protease family)
LSERARGVLWSLVYLSGGFGVAVLLAAAITALLRPAGPGGALSLAAVQAAALLVAFGGLTLLIGGRALRLTARDFGVVPLRVGAAGFGRGLLLGALLAAGTMLVAVPAGGAAWRLDGGTVGAWGGTVLVTALVLLPAALAEELVFRGVPLLALSRSFGRAPAIFLLALLFGAAHLRNPGITPLGFCTIALAGTFLGTAFFSGGGLWTSTGAHFGWNLSLAALAAPVSGLGLPMPLLDYAPGGPAWLTGAGFGPEGGILGALGFVAGTALVLRRTRKDAIA